MARVYLGGGVSDCTCRCACGGHVHVHVHVHVHGHMFQPNQRGETHLIMHVLGGIVMVYESITGLE